MTKPALDLVAEALQERGDGPFKAQVWAQHILERLAAHGHLRASAMRNTQGEPKP